MSEVKTVLVVPLTHAALLQVLLLHLLEAVWIRALVDSVIQSLCAPCRSTYEGSSCDAALRDRVLFLRCASCARHSSISAKSRCKPVTKTFRPPTEIHYDARCCLLPSSCPMTTAGPYHLSTFRVERACANTCLLGSLPS